VSEAAVEERFGPYGGRYVPETLVAALDELSAAWAEAREDPGFRDELDALLRDFVGRPTPLYLAERLSDRIGRRVYLKREDLAHTGAHKINNAVGQALLARRMGKPRVIAETGAGQHGVASATACALLGLECVVFMGTEDMRRQRTTVERMRLLGAEVSPVEAGARTLKEAVSAAIRDWVTNVRDTHYVIGSAVGPAPYPALVRDLQRVIGDEAREQVLLAEGTLPQRVIACVGGGSNAIGGFYAFLDDPVELIGVEAAGEGLDGRHGASLVAGRTGVLHGALSSVLADAEGQILEAHSVSAGLDYPGVGPEHAHLRDTGRARYVAVTDDDALRAFRELARLEGIVPALEPSHAIAWLIAEAEGAHPDRDPAAADAGAHEESPSRRRGQDIQAGAEHAAGFDLLILSGRGDKDLAEVTARLAELNA
jgi:tryptophan synthase beta chain